MFGIKRFLGWGFDYKKKTEVSGAGDLVKNEIPETQESKEESKEESNINDQIKFLTEQLEEARILIMEERANCISALSAIRALDEKKQEVELQYKIAATSLLMRLGNSCEVSSEMLELAADPAVYIKWSDNQERDRTFTLMFEELDEDEDDA